MCYVQVLKGLHYFTFFIRMIHFSYLVSVADRLAPDELLGGVPPVVGDHDFINAVELLVREPHGAAGVEVVKDRPDLE